MIATELANDIALQQRIAFERKAIKGRVSGEIAWLYRRAEAAGRGHHLAGNAPSCAQVMSEMADRIGPAIRGTWRAPSRSSPDFTAPSRPSSWPQLAFASAPVLEPGPTYNYGHGVSLPLPPPPGRYRRGGLNRCRARSGQWPSKPA